MKVIISGSRNFSNPILLVDAILTLQETFHFTEIVCGGARGVDSLGKLFGEANNIPIKLFPANWEKHGKTAGMIRNNEMAKYADVLIAFWDGKSTGTAHMITKMQHKEHYIFLYDNTQQTATRISG